MASLTAANAVIVLAAPPIISVPFQLQGFSADDVFDTASIESAEAVMGVDGVLSGGFVYVAIKQGFTLQADSASNSFFDNWFLGQKALQDTVIGSGTISLPSLGIKYDLVRGFLTGYKPSPDAKKILQPRKFEITWQSATPSPI